MKYNCIILDHDDTAVDSTRGIHYPAHIEIMKQLRPGEKIITLEEWFAKNSHPGILEYLKNELNFSEAEIKEEYIIWQNFARSRYPKFFPGFLEVIREFKSRGGRVAVISHSTKEIIERDYSNAGAKDLPEIIFGWNMDKNKRKPAIYPVKQIIKKFNLRREEIVILDDLKPAVVMGRGCGVDVAGVGWSHKVPEIVDYMQAHCNYYLNSVDELRELILDNLCSISS